MASLKALTPCREQVLVPAHIQRDQQPNSHKPDRGQGVSISTFLATIRSHADEQYSQLTIRKRHASCGSTETGGQLSVVRRPPQPEWTDPRGRRASLAWDCDAGIGVNGSAEGLIWGWWISLLGLRRCGAGWARMRRFGSGPIPPCRLRRSAVAGHHPCPPWSSQPHPPAIIGYITRHVTHRRQRGRVVLPG